MTESDEHMGPQVDDLCRDLHDAMAGMMAHAIIDRELSPVYVLQQTASVMRNIITIITGDPRDASRFFDLTNRTLTEQKLKGADHVGPAARAYHALGVKIHDAFRDRDHALKQLESTEAPEGASRRVVLAADIVHMLLEGDRFALVHAPRTAAGDVRAEDAFVLDNTESLNQKAALAAAFNLVTLGQHIEMAGPGGAA